MPDNSTTPFQSDIIRYLTNSTISKKSTRKGNGRGDLDMDMELDLDMDEIEFVDSEEEEEEETGGANGENRKEIARGSRRRARASEGNVSSKAKSTAKRARRATTANRQSRHYLLK